MNGAALKRTQIDLIKNFFLKDNSILTVYLFGSQVKDKANKYSDIDIAILFDDTVKEREYSGRQIASITSLTEALGKEVDVIVLNRASLFLKYHILKYGIKVYERPHRNEHNFEAYAIMQYFDFLPIKNRIENGLLSKIKGA